jgi:hypothetical protein
MEILMLLMAVVKAAFPLPVFVDAEDINDWLGTINEPLSKLIAAMVSQFNKTGRIAMDLQDGPLVLADSGRCLAVDQDDAAERLALACASADDGPEAWGDGKFLEILKMLLPIILQLLPLFLEPGPAPTPEPQPTPPPVV